MEQLLADVTSPLPTATAAPTATPVPTTSPTAAPTSTPVATTTPQPTPTAKPIATLAPVPTAKPVVAALTKVKSAQTTTIATPVPSAALGATPDNLPPDSYPLPHFSFALTGSAEPISTTQQHSAALFFVVLCGIVLLFAWLYKKKKIVFKR